MMTDKDNKTPDFNSSDSSTGEHLHLQRLVNEDLSVVEDNHENSGFCLGDYHQQ